LRGTRALHVPFNAWILSKSLETLAVRMDRHCDNALQLATFLEGHPRVEKVIYPFLPSHPQHELARRQMRYGGPLVTFVVSGLQMATRLVDNLQMISRTSNLGDTRSIATHPASTTHSKLSEADRAAVGILPGLIRVSVGLEHPDDIIRDIRQALEKD
jgi:O-succinylhomoserine sulfhydrylase